jgi:alkylation response protein AidB-like acyl-CoA dehydrogenase
MDFELDSTQVELQRMARTFSRDVLEPAQKAMDDTNAFPYDAWRRWSALGMTGFTIPETYGGGGGDSLSYILAMEEVATVSQTFALIWQVHVLVSNMYRLLGTEKQKREWLPRFASGEIVGAIGLTEPGAGSDAGGMTTRAERRNGEWIINGRKIFISNTGTDISDGLVLMAVTDNSGGRKSISSFIVPRGAPGFEIGQSFTKMAWHGMDSRELLFNDCRIPEENLLGIEGQGLRQALTALNLGRIVFGILGVALIRACLEESLAYAKDRKQFGKPLASFQLIQSKLADMAIHAEAVRRFAHYVAWLHAKGVDCHAQAAMVKTLGTELATKAALDAFQIHGGYGFMQEYKVNRFFRESKILEIGEGTNEIQRLVIARSLGC